MRKDGRINKRTPHRQPWHQFFSQEHPLSTQGLRRTCKEIPTHCACSFLISSNPTLIKLRAAHGKNISRYCVEVRLVETLPKPIRRNRGPGLSGCPGLTPAYPTCQVTTSIRKNMFCNPEALSRRFILQWVRPSSSACSL